MVNLKQQLCLCAAHSAGIFLPCEIKVLEELLSRAVNIGSGEPFAGGAADYFIYEEKCADSVAGFVIFGKTPMTHSSWDIYWLAVHKDYQRRGVGTRLIQRVEDCLRDDEGFATIRLETSSRKEYSGTRLFYAKAGFKETGRIPDFYASGDDLVIFYKKVESEIDSFIGVI